ncbi:type I-F CRISPR-associated helicase Cas3f [Moraxella sp. Tifton1]|uniref:type I-F CRISPR-associated helicase Cas3f n=1 Tax=Moraxella oculi TaxID=2940516 RepID=UPI0020116A62|nr:type I-F CRISPR-associated helicase Cas3f [Moraxella sp. Tifton1]MCL1622996.1 type I-F CRISPR-associated helicase Cas3f [Moraxella sp. Tifton1]
MLVIFVSQCEKKALKRTRRILDAFANRIGDRTWQTAITEDGLEMVKKLLRQSATKSTAVSCQRVRTRQRMELVWVVGNRKKFDEGGIVAVNRTKQNLLRNELGSNWQSLEAISIISTLSALLHDIGKSTKGFQQKLTASPSRFGDPYRHEWISLKLLVWLLQGCQTDEQVWQRLQTLDDFLAKNRPIAKDLQGNIDHGGFDKLPTIAQWIAWLIVTHHRLPPLIDYFFNASQRQQYLKIDNRHFKRDLTNYYQRHIKPIDYWVKNPSSIQNMTKEQQAQFFDFDDLVLDSPAWQKQIKRYAQKAEKNLMMQQLSKDNKPIADPFLLMLSRLSMMTADHSYSALTNQDKAKRVEGSKDWKGRLIANTYQKTEGTKEPKQDLDEHLLGVAHFTAKFCHYLPVLHKQMPALKNHEPLLKDTNNQAFLWQNKAFKLAQSQSKLSETHGFFGVNMASTGCGKTIGNARIMQALADPNKGARFTIALGLRVLTLQTGQSFRQNLNLTDSQLAILVGGQAQKQLFELQKTSDDTDQFGSESMENLIDEWVDADDIDDISETMNLGAVIKDDSTKKLLGSPIVTCTIDHLIQASECQRGGKYIVPMLRLFSSDLILDEPDDFDHHDLPALSRLVHLAGLFGSRVLLSSATLPPDMVAGLFQAYLAGRKIYNAQFDHASPNVCCAWFDENNLHTEHCQDNEHFQKAHDQFVQKRCQFLTQQPIRRLAKILPIVADYHGEKQAEFYQSIATQLLNQANQLHQCHHLLANDKKVSVGLMRMANIQPLMHIAQAMHQLQTIDGQENTHFYVCCYHSQQVLALRNRLENRLDNLLMRKNISAKDFIQRTDIADAIAKHPNKTNHIFIVLATAVAEVGRDHDYDWAIVEPSSMRSIIQLAGRVWRHRNDLVANTPNIGIWQHNIRALKNHSQNRPNGVAFTKPGFESEQYPLDTHDMNELIPVNILQKIDAASRIKKPTQPKSSLADLEHHVMADMMNNPKFTVVNAYFKDEHTSSRHHVHLNTLTPFRAGPTNTEYVIKPNGYSFDVYHMEIAKNEGITHDNTQNRTVQPYQLPTKSPLVDVWLDGQLDKTLTELTNTFPKLSADTITIRFSKVALAEHQHGYYFDERFGCWKKY